MLKKVLSMSLVAVMFLGLGFALLSPTMVLADAAADAADAAAAAAAAAAATADYELITTESLGLEEVGATGLGSQPIQQTVAQIIRVAMGLLGIVAVVIILIGGFTWMTAGGNDDKVAEAKKWIFSGIIGLAIILSSYALATFVLDSLVTATTVGTP